MFVKNLSATACAARDSSSADVLLGIPSSSIVMVSAVATNMRYGSIFRCSSFEYESRPSLLAAVTVKGAWPT